MESGLAVARTWGREDEERQLVGAGFLCWGDEYALELGSGDSCTTL